MQVDLIRLTFPAGLHVGSAGVGTESVRPTIPSDTLFSALLAAWVRLGRDPEPWARAFPRTRDGQIEGGDPPFLLSSAFPVAGEVLFYPKPLGYRPPELPTEREKDWKRVLFISEGVLARLRRNPKKPEIWPQTAAGDVPGPQGGALLVTAGEAAHLPAKLWEEEEVPRVALDRSTSAANLFSVGRVAFAPRCGLWFAVAWLHPDRDCGGVPFRAAFDLALNELASLGLGGDRSVGYGTFTSQFLDRGVRWDPVAEGQPMVLLSRYHPRPTELPQALTDAVAYQLDFVSGWGSSGGTTFRRRAVWLLREGSVIRKQGPGAMGDLLDIAPVGENNPGHPVWRYGLALGLPLEVGDAAAD